jgi:hypothetical protein
MAHCLAHSQTFSQFIIPSSLQSYTQANQKLTAFLNIIWKAMIGKGLNAMPALSKFLVLLALVLSASHANVFASLSSVAGNQIQINHLTQLQQPISNPTNEPSRKPICEPTKRMDLDAVLSNNLSQINNAVLSNRSNQQESLAD